MKHISVQDVLPEHLVLEIQKYIQGEYVYIPTPIDQKKKWGSHTKTRKEMSDRNKRIVGRFLSGESVGELANAFFLSESTIKRVVYGKKSFE